MYSAMNFSKFTALCHHPHDPVEEHFYHPQNIRATHLQSTPHLHPHPQSPVPSPSPRQQLTQRLSVWICPLWTFHVNGIIQLCGLCVGLLSLSVMILSVTFAARNFMFNL